MSADLEQRARAAARRVPRRPTPRGDWRGAAGRRGSRAAARGEGHGQRAADRPQVALEADLADDERGRGAAPPAAARWPPGCPSAMGRSNAEPSLRMSAGARLTVMRRERKGEPRVGQRGAHPLAALLHGAVRQTHGGEGGKPVGDVHLDVHRVGIDPEDGGGADSGKHRDAAPGWGSQPIRGRRTAEYPAIAEVDRILQQNSAAAPVARCRTWRRCPQPTAASSVQIRSSTWVGCSTVSSCCWG